MLGQRWNSKRLLVFSYMVLTSTLSARKAREIQERINSHLDLCVRGLHAGLVGDALVEGRARKVHVSRRDKEEYNRLARSFHRTMMS